MIVDHTIKVIPVDDRGGTGSRNKSRKMQQRVAQLKHKARAFGGHDKSQSIARREARYIKQREINKNRKLQ